VFLGEIFGPDLLIVVIVVAVLVFGAPPFRTGQEPRFGQVRVEKGLKEAKNNDAAPTSLRRRPRPRPPIPTSSPSSLPYSWEPATQISRVPHLNLVNPFCERTCTRLATRRDGFFE